jgi:hypothetical protein
MPPSQHDPFFGFGLPEPGPIGPRLSAELDPLACALSRLEGWTEGLDRRAGVQVSGPVHGRAGQHARLVRARRGV